MEITDVKIRRLIPGGRLRAVASVTIDDMIAIHEIRVIQGREKIFIAMPCKRDERGAFRDIVHPIKQELRQALEERIIEAYHEALAAMEAVNAEAGTEEAPEEAPAYI